ncbi:MAG: uroporphyrinogen decarboxylase family protein [Sphaerochaetaceae bacterium]|nr:uroporphyrinogen decarboxylase family protein [Sphaerochaetaceae bacterium]
MNSYERVFAAYNNKDFDSFPALNPTSIITYELMKNNNAFFPSAHLHPIETYDLAVAGHKELGFDSLSPYFSIHLEAAALGAKIDFSFKKGMPQVIEKPIKKIDDFTLPKNFLEKKEYIEFNKIIKKLNQKYNKKVPIIGKVIGPWTLAYHLFGVENLIMQTILNPNVIKNFIKELSYSPINFAKQQFENGADFVVWADHVTCDLVSPQIYEEFVLPIHQQAMAELSHYGPIILHVCGNLEDRIDKLSLSNMDMLHIDSRNDYAQSKNKMIKKMELIGFINNPYLLRKGNPKDIRKETIKLLKQGVKFVAPECAIPFNVPNENLIELTTTLHSYNLNTIEQINI